MRTALVVALLGVAGLASAADRTLAGHTDHVMTVAFSPDGKWLASGGSDGVRVWDAKLRTQKSYLAQDPTAAPKNHNDNVRTLAFSPDGKWLAAAGSGADAWDLASGKRKKLMDNQSLRSITFSPDGKSIAAGGDGGVWLWDAASGKQKAHWDPVPLYPVMTVAYAPDGKTLAVSVKDKTLRFLDALSGQQKTQVENLTKNGAVTYARDGKTLAASGGIRSDTFLLLWSVSEGKELARLLGGQGEIESLAFSPDGKTVAAADMHQAFLFEDKKDVRTLGGELPNPATSIAFAPDGKTVAVGCEDALVHLFDVN